MKLKKKKIFGNIIFLIGFPGSGKTTIAKKIKSLLVKNKISNFHLDGDSLRNVLGNLNYSKKERVKLSLMYLKLAQLLLKQTDVIILSSVSLYKEVEEVFSKKSNIKSYLIIKNFKNHNKKKNKIRNKYLKSIKFHIPKKIEKIIHNKSVLKSSNEILRDFS